MTHMTNDTVYCDDCGKDITNLPCVWVASLTRPISSANIGESAVLCKECDSKTFYVKE